MTITFKQFILMEADTDTDELLALLERDCGPFLAESKQRGLLRRGMSKLNDNDATFVSSPYSTEKVPYWKKQPRTDRRPLDIDKKIHLKLDDWFQSKFGFKARSSGLFCFGTGATSSAISQYGTEYYIFPIGEFKYAWSPNVKDLFITISTSKQRDEDDGKDSTDNIDSFMNEFKYQDTDLDQAIVSRNEIMIKCDKYYIFPTSAQDALRISLGQTVD